MPDAIVTALIAGIAATVGAILTFTLGRRRDATDRQRVTIESLSAEAVADLNRTQASSEVIQFLREEVGRLQQSHETNLERLAELSAEVGDLRTRLAEFEAIVLTLPDEYRGRFAEVLARKPRAKPGPKASSGGGL